MQLSEFAHLLYGMHAAPSRPQRLFIGTEPETCRPLTCELAVMAIEDRICLWKHSESLQT